MSLTLLIGLPILTMFGLLDFLLKWPPPSLWRGVLIVGAVLTVGYLLWALFRVLTLP
ncbi:hypothetical protein [Deinococcus budaensis]|uniref:Uncharacterized protein n=1 Tax=Deinococcus budaensis TaxID=1665626 RepID=A0A7W8LQL1_9DEIO|nr:hypothetical protein [Deinococcus budaensis]MBB5234859.1 hypothetical protein [Deinococcus budaensis]